MAKGKILKSLVKKKKPQPRYVKTPSGMKLNPERFKQKPLPKTKRLVSSPKKEALKDTAAIATAATVGFAGGKLDSAKKAKAKDKKTKQMADEAYKKQKEKQKKYYDKKTESKRK